jgi:hypothetical protein
MARMSHKRRQGMSAILAMVGIFFIVVTVKSQAPMYGVSTGLAGQQPVQSGAAWALPNEGCMDPDGLNPYTAAATTMTKAAAGGTVSSVDRCLNFRTVLERYCNGSKLESRTFTCRQGSSCMNGACIPTLPGFS